ncbi:protein phosphatase 1 regulatory subunit 14C [Lithobates pipiens]
MSALSGTEPTAGGRVFFQTPLAPHQSRDGSPPPVVPQHKQQQQKRQQQGKVTVKYDRKELRKRLVLEEWIVEQLSELYGCQEEEMPDVEIDIDDLLDASSEEERVIKLRESLVGCYKPTEEFISQLLSRIQGMRKLNPPQKKDI